MKLISLVTLAAIVTVASDAPADVPHSVCVNRGFGVPTRDGPPAWAAWAGASSSVNTELDDPRWNRATSKAFSTGTATAPMHVRQLWAPDATGQEYLYLSLVSDLDPNATTGRDVFIGFRRANVGVASPDTGVYGYVLQFHLKPGGSQTAAAMPYCGNFAKPECTDDNPSSLGNWWRVYRDFNTTKTLSCRGTTQSGEQFSQWNGVDPSPAGNDYLFAPFSWLDGAAHAWKIGGSRWAIQLRIKVAPTTVLAPALITDGIEKGSTLWYEATETIATPYVSIAKFPTAGGGRTGVAKSICVAASGTLSDSLVHPDLTDPTKYAKLTDLGPDPGDCDTGLTIGEIGARFNQAPPYDAITPLNGIKAVDSAGTVHANTMIAQVINTNPSTAANISATVQARFRLANWGSGPIGSDPGAFSDIRGGGAVCLPTGGPTCTAQSIASGAQVAVHFDWTLGNDPALGASEYCSYGIAPPGALGPCAACTCDGTQPGCASGAPGTGVAGKPCMQVHNSHECMYVELSSPTSDVNFVQASTFNNMNFAAMSSVAREALIDARKLPKAPGQTVQDIYFLVVPRNMPASVPSGTTVTGLIQAAAVDRAVRIATPYLADIDRLQREDPEKLKRIIDELARKRPGAGQDVRAAAVSREDKRFALVRRALPVMPNEDFALVGNLVAIALDRGQSERPNEALVQNAVSALGPAGAATLVPTLEVYPFYKPADEVAYQPMTSFALFLSHEATLDGIRYELDGATKVAENVYHLQIPVDYARKIQVRAQAIVGAEAVLAPGNAAWPCAGGCACGGGAQRRCGLLSVVGNTAPGLLAGVLVVRRRKKQPAKSAA